MPKVPTITKYDPKGKKPASTTPMKPNKQKGYPGKPYVTSKDDNFGYKESASDKKLPQSARKAKEKLWKSTNSDYFKVLKKGNV